MLGLSLSMLWLSVYFLYTTWKHKLPGLSKLLFLLPFTPAILVNSAIIWKDVFLGNATLLALSISVYCSAKNLTILRKHLYFFVVLILFYFAANIKFQAQFLLPMLLAFSIYLIYKLKFTKVVLWTTTLSLLFFLTSHYVNNFYKVEDNKSAQLRQFFDIAGISICLNQDLFPLFVKKEARYSFEKVIQKYDPAFVNPYVHPTEGVYLPTKNKEHLHDLEHTLYGAIFHHPICYIKHRAKVFSTLLTNRAARLENFESFSLDMSLRNKYDYENTFFVKYITSYLKFFTMFSKNLLFFILNFLFVIALYIIMRVNTFKTNLEKEDIWLCIGFNTLCIFFYATMFLTAMSADNRYLYICRLLVTFSLPLHLFLLKRFYQWYQER